MGFSAPIANSPISKSRFPRDRKATIAAGLTFALFAISAVADRRLQSQIDSQVPTLAASAAPSGQASLTLDVAGDPNRGCFVVAAHRKEERKYWDHVALDHALAILAIRIQFRTVRYPPKITLDFLGKCQFPKPFPY